MKAVLTDASGDATVEDVPKPTPDDDEVLIRVRTVQLSVTECQYLTGQASMDRFADRFSDDNGPIQLFGHEFCGEVVEVGVEVTGYAEGDRVYAPGKTTCGECQYCQRGYPEYCANKKRLGYGRPGALAEYLTAPENPLCELSDDVSDAEGAAMQPLAAAIVYVDRADIQTGDVVVVIGTGVMGYQCGQIALQYGSGEVVAVDIDPVKLEYAENAGMTTIDASEWDVVDRIDELTDGIGADVVFEAVGGDQNHAVEGSDPLAQAYEMTRPNATIVQVGNIIGEITHNPRAMADKHLTWVNLVGDTVSATPNMDTGEFANELLASDRVSIEEFITHEVQDLDSFQGAVEVTMNKTEYEALGPCQIALGSERQSGTKGED